MSDLIPVENHQPETTQSGLVDGLMDYLQKAISSADEQAAANRVIAARRKNPVATDEALAERLIKQKCLQTGMVGAVTTGTAVIPGLGTLAALTFGVAADIALTFKMQAELVLELAAVYRHELNPQEKRNTILLVTGVSAGANRLLSRTGTRIAERASQRLAERSIVKAIPVLGVAASAGTNMLTTYVIGRRAQAYFMLGPEGVEDWSESVRAVTGMDERKLVGWLTEAAENGWELVRGMPQDVAGAVIAAGKSAGELMLVGAGKARNMIVGAGKAAARGAGTAAGAVAGLGKKAGQGIAAGVDKAGAARESASQAIGSLRRGRTKGEAEEDRAEH